MSLDDALTPWLEHALTETAAPGIAVGVVFGDETVVRCHGVADTARRHPVTTETLFQIASATKPFTATAVLRLHEQGLLDLDAPVVQYLPDLRLGDPDATAYVTTRHLLTHTAGFEGDDSPVRDWGADALEASLPEFAELPQVFPPGQAMSYSNAGFRLLGILAQRLSGTPYDELVRDTVLRPLGMSASVFLPWEALGRDVALGHGTDGALWPYAQWRTELPEGGLLSTIDDMMIWARYQLHGSPGGTPVLSDRLRVAAQQQAGVASPPLAGVGLPWLLSKRHGAGIVSHGGNLSNVTVSTFDLVPDHALAVCVLANARAGKGLGDRVLRWCLEHLAELPASPCLTPVQLTRAAAAEFEGTYELGLGMFLVEPGPTGLRVLIRPREDLTEPHDEFPPVDLVYLGQDRFGATSNPGEVFCTFARDTTDAPEILHMMGRAAFRRPS
ncbi:serine hydrolase domain-containing protein [Kribbella solani]|uniref:CubicO group peptidase (Beta-lactamase class C family) n=1 Tax=Kribbella solani TaxID=236067 RepID=A0A841DKR4_9ACTN|nr:serine hydrolase domain-containing protein [Kribbella solani]MBB5977270.1 CubicO group peptidase (beta-lactamase class C family) [Kribbella solani]